MKVERDAVVALFVALGSENATKWSDARLTKKLESLPEAVDEDTELDADNAKLLKKLLKAEEIELVGTAKDEDEDEEEEVEEEDEDEDEEEEVDESDDEEEDEEEDEEVPVKKATKKKAAKKGTRPVSAGGEGKPGIIASIVEFLQAASEDKPIAKDAILAKLVKRFPDRAAESMIKTVNIQVPSRIKSDKGLNVQRNDKGYFIASEKPQAAEPEKKADKSGPKLEAKKPAAKSSGKAKAKAK